MDYNKGGSVTLKLINKLDPLLPFVHKQKWKKLTTELYFMLTHTVTDLSLLSPLSERECISVWDDITLPWLHSQHLCSHRTQRTRGQPSWPECCPHSTHAGTPPPSSSCPLAPYYPPVPGTDHRYHLAESEQVWIILIILTQFHWYLCVDKHCRAHLEPWLSSLYPAGWPFHQRSLLESSFAQT